LSETGELIADLRKIDTDLDRIESAWLLFVKSAKDFGNEQEPFIELLNHHGIGSQLNFVQMILLHDCVAAICRILDHNDEHRVTLRRAMIRANKQFGASHKVEVAPISASEKALRTSSEIESLRKFRNQYIGHTLQLDPIDVPHEIIPLVARQISEIVVSLYALTGVARWIGQTSLPVKTERAERFWRFLERGMESRYP
jgi:hypothetical protein